MKTIALAVLLAATAFPALAQYPNGITQTDQNGNPVNIGTAVLTPTGGVAAPLNKLLSGNAPIPGLLISPVLTVSTLPTCNAAAEGLIRGVSDATAPTYNATLTGGSTVHINVRCNGTAWVAD
jgi:hypothetical protein